MMRVVYCLSQTYKMGGVERVVANKANYLVQHGFEVHFVTTDQMDKSPYFQLDSRIKCHDLGINYCLNRNRTILKKVFYFFKNRRDHSNRLRSLLCSLNPDIVISTFGNEMDLLPKIRTNFKIVLEFHINRSFFTLFHRPGIMGLFEKWQNFRYESKIAHYDRFVVLTQEDARNWKRLKNIQVIPNMCTFEYQTPAVLNEKKVIAVGRYQYQKGFDKLIRAWSLVKGRSSGWKLYLVGDGELREDLQNLINEFHLDDSVLLTGMLHNMEEVYTGSSIFVMTSNYEGFPMVLLEAEAAGLPVVTFDFPCGPKDLVKNDIDGYIVEYGNIKDLAQKIDYLIEDKKKRVSMGKNAFSNAQNYKIEHVMSEWIHLFTSVYDE